ncbi:MAG TPA: S41 family peptidase [Gemmatales bacterium]|nr:S41 family peptidase [Gemmatales bacterium]HMP59021.1 S41 family peptidase [Gemmatales bacterium]
MLVPRRFLLCLCVLVLVGVPAWTAQEKELTPEQIAQNRASFKVVWETIRDKHWDPQPGGLNWDDIRAEFEPKVEKAKTQREFRQILGAMLDRLDQSHFGIVPAEVYDVIDVPDEAKEPKDSKEPKSRRRRGGQGQSGLDLRVVDSEALVTRVDEGSPAAKAGIKTGWVLEAVDGTEVAPVIRKIMDLETVVHHREFTLMRSLMQRLSGDVGDTLKLRFRDGSDQPQEVELQLGEPRGTMAIFGNLPPMLVRCDVKTLSDRIGYVHLSSFFDPPRVMPVIAQAVRDHHDATGFILDLRGNPGGIGFMAVGVGGWFVKERNLRLGHMVTRDSRLNFVLNPQPQPFLGPLAVLVDGASASTSEILAGGLQDLKRARVFGTRTMGAALPSMFVRLPNGDGFQYAFANYISAGGKPLEVHGVQPDEEVRPDRKALLEGRDQVVDAAIEWIKAQK